MAALAAYITMNIVTTTTLYMVTFTYLAYLDHHDKFVTTYHLKYFGIQIIINKYIIIMHVKYVVLVLNEWFSSCMTNCYIRFINIIFNENFQWHGSISNDQIKTEFMTNRIFVNLNQIPIKYWFYWGINWIWVVLPKLVTKTFLLERLMA